MKISTCSILKYFIYNIYFNMLSLRNNLRKQNIYLHMLVESEKKNGSECERIERL